MDLLAQYHAFNQKLEQLVGEQKFSAKDNLKLERIRVLLNLLDNPQTAFDIIHVGGTAGKGSTSTLIASLLQAQGYKTGVFLSPYLQVINETWQINSHPAKTTELISLYQQIEPLFPQVDEQTGLGFPSFFEAKLALGLLLFKQQQINVAIIEVGLGGKLDATNIVDSMISVLVSVGLDHTEILGDTVEQIAADKVEIIKPNTTAICGFTQASTIEIARAKANSVNAAFKLLGQDFSYTSQSVQTPTQIYPIDSIQLQGQFQAHNAACALMAYETYLAQKQCKPDLEAVQIGLNKGFIAGRLEHIQTQPTVILDGAHNPDKLSSLFQQVKQMGQAVTLLFALKQGKELNQDIFPMLQDLQPQRMILTQFADKGIWSAIPADELKHIIEQHCAIQTEIQVIENPLDAVEQILQQAQPQEVILITGSFFLVGDCREYWYPKQTLLQSIEENI